MVKRATRHPDDPVYRGVLLQRRHGGNSISPVGPVTAKVIPTRLIFPKSRTRRTENRQTLCSAFN
jgi:hypothetical protein